MTTIDRLTQLPAEVTVLHYDADGCLIREVPHVDGEFIEPVDVAAGEMIALAFLPDKRLAILHREP
jgi:hypothetical protein